MLRITLLLSGGALGTGCRYGLSKLIYARFTEPKFPYATFFINVTGSLIIGFLIEAFDGKVSVPQNLRIALITGLLGGYTTFSSYSYETFSLIREGEWMKAVLNAVGSMLLGLIAAWVGVKLARLI